jgi:uncharacterized membrane protein (UPF0127 family)
VAACVAQPPAALDTGDLADPVVRTVRVDDRHLAVAWVDTPAARAQGLMGVVDLGDLDGMLFDLREERHASFTMRNTLIALDIVFFDEAGRGVGKVRMVPCDAEPCPTYQAESPIRYALEYPAGSLPLRADSVLSFPDPAFTPEGVSPYNHLGRRP